jgi:hypothetical protein
MFLQPSERGFFIGSHQPTVARHVCSKDRQMDLCADGHDNVLTPAPYPPRSSASERTPPALRQVPLRDRLVGEIA